MDNLLNSLQHFSWENYLKIILIFVIVSIILHFVSKTIFRRHSMINHAISTVFCIIFIYSSVIVTHSLFKSDSFTTNLPFVSFQSDSFQFIPYRTTGLFKICSEILQLIILAFMVNVFESFLPQGANPLTWFLLRCASLTAGYAAYAVSINSLQRHLPNVISLYAPAILLGVLLLLLFTGILKIPTGALLSSANPIIGALYTFFIANVIGKQITKAIITSGILGILMLFLQSFGVNEITLNPAVWVPYLPIAVFTVILWYIAYKLF